MVTNLRKVIHLMSIIKVEKLTELAGTRMNGGTCGLMR